MEANGLWLLIRVELLHLAITGRSLGVHGLNVQVRLAHPTMSRLELMCSEEGRKHNDFLDGWIKERWKVVQEAKATRQKVEPKAVPEGLTAQHKAVSKVPEAPPRAQAATINGKVAVCPYSFDVSSVNGALELFGFARSELDCPDAFMRATITYGKHLVKTNKLKEYDIMHELIRAETGYRILKRSGGTVATGLFDAFMEFQKDLAERLQGWNLWEYEFAHWRYHKRPTSENEYDQLYNSHRPPEFQHVTCPAIPLAYRLWTNFPTCPPTRLRDLPRFTDAYVSAMTVDNWRASYRDFLSEKYNYNTSLFAGGDPTPRLSKGAHSVFAGVFIQKLPTDMWCYQQVIHDLRPQYIIDLGSSQGGSAVWFASMLKLFEIPGKVITVDLSLDQAYWLSKRRAEDAAKRLKVQDRIDWNYVVDGSKNEDVKKKVARLCSSAACMVVSDSDHDYEHTYFEMEWYAKHVGVGQYLVVEDTNIYGWSGWLNINDPNIDGLRKGPMEAANDFEFSHKADFVRTDWCTKHYGLSQTPNGWFFRQAKQARGVS